MLYVRLFTFHLACFLGSSLSFILGTGPSAGSLNVALSARRPFPSLVPWRLRSFAGHSPSLPMFAVVRIITTQLVVYEGLCARAPACLFVSVALVARLSARMYLHTFYLRL